MPKLIPPAIRQYAQFEGRMSRSQYLRWLALLFVYYMIAGWIDLQFIAPALGYLPNEDVREKYAVTIVGLLLFLPWLTASVRRLHDVSQSGWWMLFAIPMFLILYFRNEVGLSAYLFLADSFVTPLLPQSITELAIMWLPWIVNGLAALSYLPVIYWSLKKGLKQENRFGFPS
ncbi:MAG: DUF805 domain-containing protein [Hyphomicrobiales bacterium]|nr:DUF805 domain-containing protein [Hyphomicrobiales bacterium]